MILTCCFCKKEFKAKDPFIILCNKCLKKSIKKNYIKFNYSNLLKIQKDNPREDMLYNDYIKNYFNKTGDYMPKEVLKTPFSMRIDKKLLNSFQRYYPYCLSRFIILCIKKAVEDKKFFDKIYFCLGDNYGDNR